MDNHDQIENEEITERLQQLHQRLISAANAALSANPECPPVPRIKRGWLRPHEKVHVAQCSRCIRVRKRNPTFARPLVWACAAGVLLLLTLIIYRALGSPAYSIPQPDYALNAESRREITLLERVGERHMVALGRPRLQLDGRTGMETKPVLDEQRLALAQTVSPRMLGRLETLKLGVSQSIDPTTLQKLGAINGQLATVVSPRTLLALEKMDQRFARSLSPAQLLQFSDVRLQTARITGTVQLLKSERLKATLLRKLPAPVVLELAQANLETAAICGPKVLDTLWTHQVQAVGRVNSTTLLELAHRYREMAVTQKISRRRLRAIAAYDYQEAIVQGANRPSGATPDRLN